MKKEIKLRRGIDARDLPINAFFDFNDGRGYASARTRKAIFQALALYGANAYPSTQTLVSKCGITEQHVRRTIKWLKENGFLRVEYKKGPHGTNLYNVEFPSTPEHLDDAPEHLEGDPNISGGVPEHDHVPQKKESIKERESEKGRIKPAHASLEVAAGQVLKEIARAGGTVTRKDSAAIHKLIADSDWTDAEIISATKTVLDKLDTWEMKQAGDRVSSSICCEIELKRESDAKLAANESLLQTETELARQGVERELQELESEVIETTL